MFYVRLIYVLYIKGMTLWICQIKMNCKLKALRKDYSLGATVQHFHAQHHAAVEPHANILGANLFHFCFSSSEIVVPCLKYWVSKLWLYSFWMKMRIKKPLQRKLEYIGLDPDLDVIIHYSKKAKVIRKF